MTATMKGWRTATVVCAHCSAVTERTHYVGQPPPAYCDRACQAAAKRHRRKAGTQHEPNPVNEPQPCPGCGVVARLGRRAGFAACDTCRARLHGSCVRKTPYRTEGGAAEFSEAHHLGQLPYQCAFCGLWHLTSAHTAGELPGDTELGERLRAAGFRREAVR